MSLKEDLIERQNDTQIGIELFLKTKGRLPNQHGDDITKKIAKEFLDKCHKEGTLKENAYLIEFAFHVYASTNLAYE